MPLPFSIDDLEFHLMDTAHPHFVRQNILIETRTGLDGVAAIATGTWGSPQQAKTTRWFADKAVAYAAARAYSTYVAVTPRTLVFQAVNWFSIYATKYIVLDVEVEPLQGLPMVVADTVYAPAWQVVANWQLQPFGV